MVSNKPCYENSSSSCFSQPYFKKERKTYTQIPKQLNTMKWNIYFFMFRSILKT